MVSPKLINFIKNHAVLFSISFALLILILKEELKYQWIIKGLTPQEVINFMNQSKAMLIDIRTQEDFAKSHIIDAISIPDSSLVKTLNKKNEKDTPIIITCSQGKRCFPVATKLKKSGFKKVYILKGGMQAWNQAGLPLIS